MQQPREVMRTGTGEVGAVEMRWLLTLLGVCIAALGAGFLVGFWLGS
jgi:hypothetical protein